MFGSTTSFGQSSSSPFGAPSIFGQPSSGSNLFAHKPFGSPGSFPAQTGQSIFGGTSTGVFGVAQSSSSLASTPVFGASSTPAFGGNTFGTSSVPAFGASSTPAFGASSAPSFGGSSSFGGSPIFGQKPAFGGFGSAPSQASPFGGSFQQSQPAFGSSLFGSTTPGFGSSSTAFGATSVPSFGTAGSPAFGATTTPAFGATSTPAFGISSSAGFGSSMPAFGTNTSAFGSSSTPAFGTATFGTSSAPAFGSATPAFGGLSTPGFGTSSTPSFNFGSSSAFGQQAPAFSGSAFGTTSPFGASSSFGLQTAAPVFGSPGFGQLAVGGQRAGSRVTSYIPTVDVDGASGTQSAGKLESISAMPAYKDKSHEELRWEDYQLGDKGGPSQAGLPSSGIGFGTSGQSGSFATGVFGQTTANPFLSVTGSNPFAPKTATFGPSGTGSSSVSSFSSPFSVTPGAFANTGSSSAPSIFGSASTPIFGVQSSSSLFGTSGSPAFGLSSSSSPFGSVPASGSVPVFGSSLSSMSNQSSGAFQLTTTPFGQTASAFSSVAPFGQSSSAFGQPSLFGPSSTAFGGSLFNSSTQSLLNSSSPAGFVQSTPSLSTPVQASNAFSFGNFGQTQSVASSNFLGTSNPFGQGSFGPSAVGQSLQVAQPVQVTSPFGTLPAVPQMSIGRTGSSPVIHYGISSMPIADKPLAPAKISSLLTGRHLSQRRIRLPPRKYHPKTDGPKIPFFVDDELPTKPKADALLVPRENPRALVVRPIEQWPSRIDKQAHLAAPIAGEYATGGSFAYVNGSREQDTSRAQNGFSMQHIGPSHLNGFHFHDDGSKERNVNEKQDQHTGVRGSYFHEADVDNLMPKLQSSDYYTEPQIPELVAKERAEPGYCRHVKDFIVGRHGYGSIKFLGETDVRSLDLEHIVQFNSKEVIVYMDDSKKPAVGHGLNKPAEVTLLNIKCINRKTGEQYTKGPKVEKYKEMLVKKAQEQGADFVSYDPVKGEWKFRVSHFSLYGFWDDTEEESSISIR